MNNREFTMKWGEFTSDVELTEAETLAMEELIEADAVLRAEVAEDHQLHRMLESLGEIHDTQDEFVSDVMAACTGVDNPVAQLLVDSPPRRSWPWRISAGWLVATIPCVLLLGAYLVLRSQVDAARSQATMARLAAERAEQRAGRLLTGVVGKESVALVEPKQSVEPAKPAPAPSPAPAQIETRPTAPTAPTPPISATTIATLTRQARCVWKRRPKSKELVAGEYELIEGSAILRTTGGSTISVLAPSRFELHHPTYMSLHAGNIQVQVARDDVGFRVNTPNSKVIDLGTQFTVSLNDEGQTRVRLDTGEVAVLAQQSATSRDRHYLKVGEYEIAVVRGDASNPDGLHGSYASGPAGFAGNISLAGETHKFGSLQRFNHVYSSVSKTYRDHPQETQVAWLQLQKVLERLSVTATQGSVEVTFAGLDGVMELEELFTKLPSSANALDHLNSQKANNVKGALVVAGRRYPFQTAKQYESARERALRVLSQIGLPSLLKSREEADRGTNPFDSLRKSLRESP